MPAFRRYGGGRGFSLQELVDRQRDQQLLTARAEDSGCEGTYVEVSEWSNDRQRWERLCFLKCFGGEYPGEPELPETETALRFVKDINAASWLADEAPLIHCLPNVPDGTTSPVTLEEYLRSLDRFNASALADSFRGEFDDLLAVPLASHVGRHCKQLTEDLMKLADSFRDSPSFTEADEWQLWFRAGQSMLVWLRS